ncbi:hypothetical protein [Rhodohalobacter sulfatireducens]|uniref:Uncharacterized protein n=1 Tax=Rhodohalobacter sulfatireducens TaxID=2911366 RepID=A0ABS9KDZ4_9BACT|nr:hypothetical protein [Rhodohalobacter sulfatireducens]MCG2589050.1 hypothetical protein [Rhodohalobacter sulfatireducens]
MPLLDRSDLKYDYNWETGPATAPRTETTTVTETESRLFRRDEGDEVLDFINQYSEEHENFEKEDALEIERLLRDELKNDDMTRKEVRLWLNNHLRNV